MYLFEQFFFVSALTDSKTGLFEKCLSRDFEQVHVVQGRSIENRLYMLVSRFCLHLKGFNNIRGF